MILGWVDPKGRRVALDDPMATMKLGMPRQLLYNIAEQDESDERHRGTNITATGPNGCPRSLAITRMFDIYVEPQKQWTMASGTYLHEKFAELHDEERGSDGELVWYTEEGHPDKCTLEGKLGNRKVGAMLDMVSRNAYSKDVKLGPYNDSTVALWDWKTSMNAASRYAGREKQGKQWVHTGKAGASHTAQLNIGRMLLEQKVGREFSPDDIVMCAWVISKNIVDTYCDHLSWEQVRELRTTGQPYAYTYGELYDVVGQVFDTWQEMALEYEGDIDAVPDEKKLEIIKALPLYGLQMYQNRYGDNSCDRCPIKKMCSMIDGGI